MPVPTPSRGSAADLNWEHGAIALLAFMLCACADAHAYQEPGVSQLPATPLSSESNVSTPTARNSHRSAVTYDGTALTVAANDSSLNQIVHEIARLTGMKITGVVAEDRVFGTYGPAAPSVVLGALLDGTGSNMLLVQNASHVPTELILSPRTGRITPPNPNPASSDENDDASEPTPQPVRSAAPLPAALAPTNSRAPYRAGTGGVDTNPAATAPSSTSQQLVFPPINASTPPSTGTTTPTTADPSPDAVRTPQQIFEQLQKLRQQQSQQPTKPQ